MLTGRRRVFGNSLDEGLLLYMPLDENAANTTTYEKMRGLTGAVSGSTGNTEDMHRVGLLDGAMEFDLSSDVNTYTLPADIAAALGHDQTFTISLWFKSKPAGSYTDDYRSLLSTIDAASAVGGKGLSIILMKYFAPYYNRPYFLFRQGSAYGRVYKSLVNIPLDTWTHLTVVRKSGALSNATMDVYVNGATETSAAYAGSGTVTNTVSTNLTIGDSLDVPATFLHADSTIQHVKIWNRVLSLEEAVIDYNGGTPLQPKYYPSVEETTYPRLFDNHPTLETDIIAAYRLSDNAASTHVRDELGQRDGTSSTNTSNLSVAGNVESAAFYLDGSLDENVSSAIESSPGDTFDVGQPFSYDFYLKLDSIPTNDMWILGNTHATSTRGHRVGLVYSGGLYRLGMMFVDDSSNYRVHATTTTVLTTGSWLHCYISYDGTSADLAACISVSIDDSSKSIATTSTSGTVGTFANSSWYIGKSSDTGTARFTGHIESVCVHQRELEAGEITNRSAGVSILRRSH